MITKVEHRNRVFVKTGLGGKKIHIEDHLVITYWFLFIPIFRYKKLIGTNL